MIPLAIRCLDSPALSADRAFGWDERAGTLFAIAAGYFLWDTIDTIMYFEGFGFVAHGSCYFAIPDQCTDLPVENHRHSVFLRVLLVFRKPPRRHCVKIVLMIYTAPILGLLRRAVLTLGRVNPSLELRCTY